MRWGRRLLLPRWGGPPAAAAALGRGGAGSGKVEGCGEWRRRWQQQLLAAGWLAAVPAQLWRARTAAARLPALSNPSASPPAPPLQR